MTTQFSTPDEVFRDADRRLRAGLDALAGTTAVYLFNLAGPDGGSFYIRLEDGFGSAGTGAAADPDLTFSMSAEDFVAIIRGDLDGALSFMTGRLTMRGDESLSLALAPLWLQDTDWASQQNDAPF